MRVSLRVAGVCAGLLAIPAAATAAGSPTAELLDEWIVVPSPPSEERPAAPPADAPEGRLVFEEEFDYKASRGGGNNPPETLDKKRWRTDKPDQPRGQGWWNSSKNNNVILPGDGTIQLQLKWQDGEVTTAGRLSSSELWAIEPPTRSESVLVEGIIKTPNTVGAWPTMWFISNTGQHVPEYDVLEVFGQPKKASATYHPRERDGTRGEERQVHVEGTWTQSFHSFAARWHHDRIEFFYDRKKVLDTKPVTGNDHPCWLIFSHAGLNQSRQGWPPKSDRLRGSGSALEVIDSVRIWRGGSGPPPKR
jgi:hypothetical protein